MTIDVNRGSSSQSFLVEVLSVIQTGPPPASLVMTNTIFDYLTLEISTSLGLRISRAFAWQLWTDIDNWPTIKRLKRKSSRQRSKDIHENRSTEPDHFAF